MKYYFKCSNCLLDIKTSKTNYYRNLKKDVNICRQCHLELSSERLSVMVQGVKITQHRFYSVWYNMIRRCFNEKTVHYNLYGGRGIAVCEEWRNSLTFVNWCIDYENILGKIPEGYHLDRIDNDKGYCPKNCQFLSPKENNRKRNFVKLTYEKAVKIREYYSSGVSVNELAKFYGVSKYCIYDCIRYKTFKDN